MRKKKCRCYSWCIVGIVTGACLIAAGVTSGAVKTEFHPVLFVSTEYTDNANQASDHKDEDVTTTYGGDFTVKFIRKNGEAAITYTPEFVDRDSDDTAGDTWEHNAALTADLRPSQRVQMDLSLTYDGHDSDVDNESWAHTGAFNTIVDITSRTRAMAGLRYANAFERRQVSGHYQEQTEHGGSVAVSHRFGGKNLLSLSMDYTAVDFDAPVADDYETWSPGISLSWWLNPCWGIMFNTSYEHIAYDLLDRRLENVTGQFRSIRCLNSHFQVYTDYRHIYSDRDLYAMNTFLPSVGFNWDVTDDAGISLGVGYLYQEWAGEHSGRLFVDADIFKTIDFTRHAGLTLTAGSTIDPTSDDAASLGFQVQYQTGFMFNWALMENFDLCVHGDWTRDEFTESNTDRRDHTLNVGGGFSWHPWRQATLLVDYTYEDFHTDAVVREDYQEHRGTVTLRLHPARDASGASGRSDAMEQVQ